MPRRGTTLQVTTQHRHSSICGSRGLGGWVGGYTGTKRTETKSPRYILVRPKQANTKFQPDPSTIFGHETFKWAVRQHILILYTHRPNFANNNEEGEGEQN
jgi:hypothetical protein